DLQHRLPSFLLRKPYEILNRINRNRLSKSKDVAASSITYNDFKLAEENEQNLDLFCLITK
ncbi:MAG: SAM-dependent methyltransferase, partial [Bacteroidota bacterium]